MINNEAFAKRLQKVMDFYGESASSFAEKIAVQRSSISHILSGRNKPSLDFIMKVLSSYPEVELYWLLNGKGVFPAKQQKDTPPLENSSQIALKENRAKTIERIVIFYKDGSFKSFKE
ncbi:MAG: helix-turn-helix domain-containing protein [Flavobacteriaceae bacterium]|nr:helix-turn-helix domain-containing protein [Flavobacteriaceae bacterium]